MFRKKTLIFNKEKKKTVLQLKFDRREKRKGIWGVKVFNRGANLLSSILSLFDGTSMHRGGSNEPITPLLLIILKDEMKCHPLGF